MNNLYNKIYKAINEGVVKSLQIPDEQNDNPVNYTHSKVKDSMYSKEDFENAFNSLCNKSSVENYNNVLKYSMNGIHQHSVKDHNELNDIFSKIYSLDLGNNIDLFWLDTTDILTFVMKNGDEVSLGDIDDVNNVIFVKFNNIQNFDYPIIIHKNLLISNAKQKWATIKNDIKTVNVKDGYKNTYNANIINDLNNYPAFEYCVNQSINEYKGYLPSINELNFLSKNENVSNYISWYITGKGTYIHLYHWWSSTQYDNGTAWCLSNGSQSIGNKLSSLQVLPFFRKIK